MPRLGQRPQPRARFLTTLRPLATAALIGASLAGAPAAAAEIGSGGALDLTISGYVATNAYGGALDNQRQDPDLSTELDFGTDVEMYLNLDGEDEATGLEYGATVELDADTNTTENTYETWVYLSGSWGELRLGDEEGPVDESALGADTIAAGTGGIDGDIVDELAVDDVAHDLRRGDQDWFGWQKRAKSPFKP